LQIVNDEIKELYGGTVRLRVCGIYIENDRILLINHSLYGKSHFFWSPPGGGVRFGESAIEALAREFKEEAGVDIEVGELLFVHEHIRPPLHAVEMFFRVNSYTGTLGRGTDPEISEAGQIIEDIRFLSWHEISRFKEDEVHAIFSLTNSLEGVLNLGNYISGVKSRFDK
jgi:8-oxo-dGTP diphosphatase